MKKGIFITFEGGEGTGKSLQSKLLYDYLKSIERRVVMTREPGGTPLSEEIRNVLLTGSPDKMDPVTESLLYLASRSYHWNSFIKPLLNDDHIVICDRFQDSTIVYQGMCKGVSINLLNSIFKEFTVEKIPDRTYLIDLDPDIGISRSLSRADNLETRFEKMDINYHKKVREGFLELAKNEPKRFLVIDGSLQIQEIQEIVLNDVQNFLPTLTKY